MTHTRRSPYEPEKNDGSKRHSRQEPEAAPEAPEPEPVPEPEATGDESESDGE